MAEYSVMDRINMIISDPDHATMTLAQIVTEEIREFKASEQYANMIQAEAYYRNRTDVQRKTNDVANRSNTRIEHPILKKLVDQKANYLLGKPFTVDTKNSSYGDALNDVFDQTFRRKIKSLGKGAVKSGIAWLQPYFDDGKLAFMRIPSAELVPIWRDAERTKLDAFIRFYDQVIYIGTRKHTITHAELWWTGGVKYFKTDAFAGTIAGDFIVDTEHGDEANDYTEPHFTVGNNAYNWDTVPIVWLKYNEEELPLCYFIKDLIDDINWQTSVTADVLRDVAKFIYILKNYGGQDLGEFIKDLKEHMAIKVTTDGGKKLEKAMQVFPISLEGCTCIDIGASTGGFTDCMLQNGAKKVYSVDVGYGQLAWSLRTDERVVNLERTNIRYVTEEQIPDPIDFISVDVSFISLTLVLPIAWKLLKDQACMVCLVKPQFEAGKDKVGKKGVVREPQIHKEVIRKVADCAVDLGFAVKGLDYSPIKGPEGNIEYLLFLQKTDSEGGLSDEIIDQTVAAAHESL